MNKTGFVSNPLRIAQTLFGLNAAIWLLIGIVSLDRIASQNPEQSMTSTIVAILILGNVGAMLLSAWLIGEQKTGFYFFALAVLLVNILLTFTDQFGLFDLLTLIIDLILLGILLAARKRLHSADTITQIEQKDLGG